MTPFSRSLRAQVDIAFGFLVVVLAVSLSIALASLLKQRIQRDEGQQLRAVSTNVAQVLADGLFARSREIDVLSRAHDVWAQGLGSSDARRLLDRAQATQPDNTWIGLTDTEGTIQAATGGVMIGRNAKERPWFAPGLKGLYVGDVHAAKMLAALLPPGPDGEPLRFVDFSAPVQLDGKTVGVLVAHGTWRWAHAVIEQLRPESASVRHLESFIFDRAGKMIYAPGRTLEGHLAAGQTLPSLAGGAADVVHWKDGAKYLTAATPVRAHTAVSDLGWTVVSREPVNIAFAEADRSALQALLIGLLFAGGAAAFAWWLAGRLTHPLHEMARAARAVEEGVPGADIPQFNTSTEVRDLSGALSTMTHKLLRANSELEERVAARTSELEQANLELNKLARHDPLTGLLNRRGFYERLKSTLSSAARRDAPVSVIMIDADHFKRVNDTFGHEAGDAALKAIAESLQRRLRESDVVARFGGEEFVALLPDTAMDGAQAVAEGLVTMIAGQPVPGAGRLTISCGVSAVRVGFEDGAEALRQADAALYRAKSAGRNRAVRSDDEVV